MSMNNINTYYVHFLKNDALGVRRSSERLLPLVTQVTLLVRLVSPKLGPAVVLELTPSSHTTCLTAKTNETHQHIIPRKETHQHIIPVHTNLYIPRKERRATERDRENTIQLI